MKMLPGWWLCFLLGAVSAQSESPVYRKVGDPVVLKPGSVPDTITSILWKHGDNIAIQWDHSDPEIIYYRQFKVRSSLNISSGEMTIRELTHNDSGLYKPEINGGSDSSLFPATRLTVISPVPVPQVTESCNDQKTSCTFTCESTAGTDAEPVTYEWKSDGKVIASSKELHVTKENNSSMFTCEMKNPVSESSSDPIPNPFNNNNTSSPKTYTGLTVFICLLLFVLLLFVIHRWKAGMWFFQKASMPWEADFWTKQERRSSYDANGTTDHKENKRTEEETPMT